MAIQEGQEERSINISLREPSLKPMEQCKLQAMGEQLMEVLLNSNRTIGHGWIEGVTLVIMGMEAEALNSRHSLVNSLIKDRAVLMATSVAMLTGKKS